MTITATSVDRRRVEHGSDETAEPKRAEERRPEVLPRGDDHYLLSLEGYARNVGQPASKDARVNKEDLGATRAFIGGATPGDVRQGDLGNCTVMSSLAALARTPKGQRFLESRVQEHLGRDGKVASYTVLVSQNVGGGRRADIPVEVDAHALPKGHWIGDAKAGAVEVWPIVFEAALAKAQGGLDAMDKGSTVPKSFAYITGHEAVDSSPRTKDFADRLRADFAAGKALVLSTNGTTEAPPGGWNGGNPKLYDAHAYAITDVRDVATRGADGRYHVETFVTVRNPWGFDHPRPMTLAEMQRHFGAYSVGEVP